MRVDIVGAGPAGRAYLTQDGLAALEAAHLVIGARRVLEALGLPERIEQVALSDTAKVAELLAERQAQGLERAAVAVSGDVGLYSLAAPLRARLEGMAGVEVREHPGVSSLQLLCSRLHMPWQDAHVLSAHGRMCDVAGAARSHALTFALTGGATRAQDVCRSLAEQGLGGLPVHVGERLGMDQERIVGGTAAEVADETFGDLACMLIENPSPIVRAWQAPGLRDDDFERGEAPMTKEEVRQAAVCKLRLHADSLVWDIGAGTGSVSVECALAARAGRVFAIEDKPERMGLVARNAERLGASNVCCVLGRAPEALASLPAPTHAFIGGTQGELAGIVEAVLGANPKARLVIAAVCVETLSQALECCRTYGLGDVEVVQLSVARARRAGQLHLMAANNPVWLVSAQGAPSEGGLPC